MNKRALRLFKYIVTYKRLNDGNSPRIRQIGQACGVTSTSMVDRYLKQLEQAGMIRIIGEPGFLPTIQVVGGKWVYGRSNRTAVQE